MLALLRKKRPAAAAEPAPAAAPTQGDLEALLANLDWKVLRRLDGILQGQNRSLFRGAGLDLAEIREYQAHDDVRHIDWNVTARLQVPHVREHQEDREVSAWFLLDMTGSMGFGSQGQSKRALMLSFVGVMAQMLMRRGNRRRTVAPGLNPSCEVVADRPDCRQGRRRGGGEFRTRDCLRFTCERYLRPTNRLMPSNVFSTRVREPRRRERTERTKDTGTRTTPCAFVVSTRVGDSLAKPLDHA